MSQIRTNSLVPAGGLAGDGGGIIQIVQGLYKGSETISSGSYVATSITATITPSSTSSKILAVCVVHVGVTGTQEGLHGRLYRNGSNISGALGNTAGSRDRAWLHVGAHYSQWEQYPATAFYLDSPASTSAQTYTLYGRGYGAAQSIKINSNESDPDDAQQSRTVSSMTLMEISG
jgi:hypothetical protein